MEMNRQSLGFARRLTYIAKSLSDEEHGAYMAGDSQRANAIGAEFTNVTSLRESLDMSSAYLFAAMYLASAREEMLDPRDRSVVVDHLRMMASDAKTSLSNTLASAESLVTATKRPGVAAEVSKVAEFVSQARDAFSSCAAAVSRGGK
jgi:predicted TIM-barrel fold metal-dependent hydrolase